jgi:hypothetical protein
VRLIGTAVLVAAVASMAGRAPVVAQAPGSAVAAPQPAVYYPARGAWETRKPEDVGMDPALLAQAIEYAKTRDTNWGKANYMADQLRTFGSPLGPVRRRTGPTNGIVIRRYRRRVWRHQRGQANLQR